MRPQDWAAKHLLFDAFFQKREWAPALALIEELNRQRPDDARLQKALVVTLSNMKRYNEAIAQAHRHIVRHGEDPTIIDVLKVAHFYTGKLADAVNYGQRGLELRDAEASALPPAGKLTARRAACRQEHHLVFALGHGAVLLLWRHDQSGAEPHGLSRLDLPVLCGCHGAARLRRFSRRQRRRRAADGGRISGVGLFQRFLVMNDQSVGRFLVRDCDARLSAEEAELVRQWIDSDYPFHAVRDHVLHNELMIGCRGPDAPIAASTSSI